MFIVYVTQFLYCTGSCNTGSLYIHRTPCNTGSMYSDILYMIGHPVIQGRAVLQGVLCICAGTLYYRNLYSCITGSCIMGTLYYMDPVLQGTCITGPCIIPGLCITETLYYRVSLCIYRGTLYYRDPVLQEPCIYIVHPVIQGPCLTGTCIAVLQEPV